MNPIKLYGDLDLNGNNVTNIGTLHMVASRMIGKLTLTAGENSVDFDGSEDVDFELHTSDLNGITSIVDGSGEPYPKSGTVVTIPVTQGTQGYKGYQGEQGYQGLQGYQGTSGTDGTQGLQGYQGIAGETSAQGIQGLQGLAGEDSLQGIQGLQGLAGEDSLQGIQGYQGLSGANGSQGIQGYQGFPGETSLQGTQGLQGIAGTDSTQGLQGYQGTAGANGTSISYTASATANTLVYRDSTGSSYFVNAYASNGFYNSSDERLKDIIGDLDPKGTLEKLASLRKIRYTLKSDETKKVELGIIAQEIQKIYPELVTEDAQGYLAVDYSKMTVLNLLAIDELIDKYNILNNL